MEVKKRKVKASTIDVMVDAIGAAGRNMYLFAIIDMKYALLTSLLKRALSNLWRTEPLIGARLNWIDKTAFWMVDPNPEWEIHEYHGVTEESFKHIENDILKEPGTHIGVLPVTLYVMHMQDGTDRLMIKVNHLLADGAGIKNLMYRFAETYKKCKEDSTWQAKIDKGSPRGRRRLLKALRPRAIKKIFRGLSGDLKSLAYKPYFSLPIQKGEVRKGRYVTLDLDKDRVEHLKAKWKHEGITVNDILLSAYSRALWACFKSKPDQVESLGIFSTVDLRKNVDRADYINNFSTARIIEPESPEKVNHPHDYIKSIAKKTAAWKANYPGVGYSLFSGFMQRLYSHKTVKDFICKSFSGDSMPIGFTNIGIIDSKRLDFGDGSPMYARINTTIPFYKVSTTATGCNGAVTFSFGYWSSVISDKDAKALIEEIDHQIMILE